jgi:hypothetical protein
MKKSFFVLSILAFITSNCGQTTQNKSKEIHEENNLPENSEISDSSNISQLISIDVAEENFQKNTVWICEDSNMAIFQKFGFDTNQLTMDFIYTPFEVNESYKINDLTLLFGGYNSYVPDTISISPPYSTDKDYGTRLLCFNAKNQLIFRSWGSFDSFMFIPCFWVSDDLKQFLILCQLGDEMGNMGAEVFLIEENEIYLLGHISEPYDTEIYSGDMVVEIVNIKRIDNTLEFSFPDTLTVQDDNQDLMDYEDVKLDINIKYIYKDGKLAKENIKE